jgi:hypothetical protein
MGYSCHLVAAQDDGKYSPMVISILAVGVQGGQAGFWELLHGGARSSDMLILRSC